MPEDSLQHTPSGDGDRGTAGAGGAAGGCGCPGGAGELRPHGRRAGATEAEMGSELGFHYCQSRGVAHLGFQRAGASHPPLQQSSSCCGHSKRKAGVALSKAGGQAGLQERAFTASTARAWGDTRRGCVDGRWAPPPYLCQHQWTAPPPAPPPTNSGWSSVHLEQETDQDGPVAGEARPLRHAAPLTRGEWRAGWEQEEQPRQSEPGLRQPVCTAHHAGDGGLRPRA